MISTSNHPLAESVASERLAVYLHNQWSRDAVTSVTWLNHHSLRVIRGRILATLARFDVIGIDGLLLLRLLGGSARERTSADLVVPRVLPLLRDARVALVGGRLPSLMRSAETISAKFLGPGSSIVGVRDGFNGLPQGPAIEEWLRSCRPNVVLVGLGAGLQEDWALEACAVLPTGLVLTCGGLFDQLSYDAYYPAWAYPLRINWAVRLAREPRRLWMRYTMEALLALLDQDASRKEIPCLAGFHTHRAVVIGAPSS